MNKQEAIEKIEQMIEKELLVTTTSVISIISQIDEQQKPVIPKYVAEWLEEARAEEYSLYGAWEMVKEGSEIFWWLFDGHESNQDTFNRAWLDGYEIEKEKLYTVEIPNPNLNAHVVLQKTGDGIVLVTVGNAGWAEWESSKLTESEIKQDFEWAFQFAKPVEEKQMPEYFTTEDFTTPIECLSEALEYTQYIYDEEGIKVRENTEQLIESYMRAIELLMKEEVE